MRPDDGFQEVRTAITQARPQITPDQLERVIRWLRQLDDRKTKT